MIPDLQVRRRALATDRQPSLARLLGFHRVRPRRLLTGWDLAEMLLDTPKGLVGVDVADNHEGGVVRNVVAAVVTVEIVAAHRFQIGHPPDGGMAVRVRLERGRGQLLVEQLVGIVFPALELRDDHRALGLAIVGMIQAAGHALGLDEQHAIEGVSRGGFEIRRLIDEGVAIPAAPNCSMMPFT